MSKPEPEYSGKTLGDVEIFVKPGSVLGGIFLMDGRQQPIGGSPLVPTRPKHGDRIIITIRNDAAAIAAHEAERHDLITNRERRNR